MRLERAKNDVEVKDSTTPTYNTLNRKDDGSSNNIDLTYKNKFNNNNDETINETDMKEIEEVKENIDKVRKQSQNLNNNPYITSNNINLSGGNKGILEQNNNNNYNNNIEKDGIPTNENNLDTTVDNNPLMKLFKIVMSSPPETLQAEDLKFFLNSPIPLNCVFKCNVLRKKDGLDKLYPKYFVYTYPNDRFIMAARKRPKNTTSNYMLTLSHDTFEKDSNYMAKLRSNFFGTEFNLYDTGKNPKDTIDPQEMRQHYSVIKYVLIL